MKRQKEGRRVEEARRGRDDTDGGAPLGASTPRLVVCERELELTGNTDLWRFWLQMCLWAERLLLWDQGQGPRKQHLDRVMGLLADLLHMDPQTKAVTSTAAVHCVCVCAHGCACTCVCWLKICKWLADGWMNSVHAPKVINLDKLHYAKLKHPDHAQTVLENINGRVIKGRVRIMRGCLKDGIKPLNWINTDTFLCTKLYCMKYNKSS